MWRMVARLINVINKENVVAMEMRDDGGLSQKMVMEMKKTDGFKRYSRLDLLSCIPHIWGMGGVKVTKISVLSH